MFSTTADSSGLASRPSVSGSNSRSVLSSDLKITGEVRSSGAVEILGEVDGTIIAQSLIVGSEGRVSGDVTADHVEIKGKIDGTVSSADFTLRAAAQVTADVVYKTLVIESGAQIEGRFQKST